MPSIFSNVTHALVQLNSAEVAQETGNYVIVDLCFGPGDENRIAGIKYVKMDGKFGWVTPYEVEGQKKDQIFKQVFTGVLKEDAVKVAARSLERIKETYAKPEWGKRYRVDKAGVQKEVDISA